MRITAKETRAGKASPTAPWSRCTGWTPRLVAAALALGVSLAFAPAASPIPAAGRPVPRLSNPTKTGSTLVNRFFVLLQRKDRAGLRRLLSPAFQVQRADGSSAGRSQYLANLATINKFALTKPKATQAGAALVVRYLAEVEGVVNGKPYTPGPAPRLSVFVWNGTRWLLAAHANFNPLGG